MLKLAKGSHAIINAIEQEENAESGERAATETDEPDF